MPISSGQILKIKHFGMSYPKSRGWALEDITLEIQSGESLALVGPSGCGKSTLAKVILQLLPEGTVTRGEVLLQGKDPRLLSREGLRKLRGEGVGLIFQDPMSRLNPLMNAGEHIVDTLRSHQKQASIQSQQETAKELLERIGIGENRFNAYPHELSGGMRQRLAIGLAIALKPPLLIADEPTTSLDMAVANQIMGELSNLCKETGSALLLISHDLAMTARWCNRIAVLDNGRIVEEGKIQEILTFPKSLTGTRLVKAARDKEEQHAPESKNDVLLEIIQLRCWHSLGSWPWSSKWIKAINEISFSLSSKETLGIVGASGCGKSTLCKALVGLTKTRGGEIKLEGRSILNRQGKFLTKARKDIQMVFQDPQACLNPKMPVGEAIADPLLIHNLATKARSREIARELLGKVGLKPSEKYENRLPKELSGGEQQRVAIARAISLKPKVLICDESVSMLDCEVQHEILILLKKLQSDLGLAILFITHDLSVAKGFCNRIIVLDQGKIVEENQANNLICSPKASITQKLVKACPKLPIINPSSCI